MKDWFVSSLIALVLFGLWGFFPKLSVARMDPLSSILYGILGTVVTGIFLYLKPGFRLGFHPAGAIYGILAGVCGILGSLYYFRAAQKGKLSLVVVITALYPLVTILLARCLLGETLSHRQIAGIILACLAVFLLASEG
ncbi:MAG: EamA family transporter [Deltaproteobacteria bacterium]